MGFFALCPDALEAYVFSVDDVDGSGSMEVEFFIDSNGFWQKWGVCVEGALV